MLYALAFQNTNSEPLKDGERAAVIYHDLFEYPLTFAELIKWKVKEGKSKNMPEKSIVSKNGYFYVEGHDGLIYKKTLRKRISLKKLLIAQKSAKILSIIPFIQMIGLTGSLAMDNATDESDIDLIIITKSNRLWTSRILVYFLINLFGLNVRKANDKRQKDRLCLNMWLTDQDLIWPKKNRNLYTAHELAQIKPLFNRNNTYERFIYLNKWILNYWPNALKIEKLKVKLNNKSHLDLIEKVCYWAQSRYMHKKITKETVTPTKALFHPVNWSKIVLNRL